MTTTMTPELARIQYAQREALVACASGLPWGTLSKGEVIANLPRGLDREQAFAQLLENGFIRREGDGYARVKARPTPEPTPEPPQDTPDQRWMRLLVREEIEKAFRERGI